MNYPVAIRAEALEIFQSRLMFVVHVPYVSLVMVHLNASLADLFTVSFYRIHFAALTE